MPEISFIGQPFDAQLGVTLRTVLQDPGIETLWIATAWGKASGLTRIGDAIKKARSDRGLHAQIVLGVDENGATVEGLRHAMDIFDTAYVFHDPGSRTFHPKIYGAQGPKVATVIVGSGNLTKGGLYSNYEASTVVRITDAAADLPGSDYVKDVRSFYDQLVALTDSCKVLTEESLAALRVDPRVSVLSEAERNRARGAARQVKTPPADGSASLFGSSVKGLLNAPPASLPPIEGDDEDSDEGAPAPTPVPAPTPASSSATAPVPGTTPVEASGTDEDEEEAEATGFWKRLSKFDASPTSAPGQILIPIRFLDFFPTMTDEAAKTSGGAQQSAATFPLTFRDGGTTIAVTDARVILYTPAPDHPRPNPEIRFTFHNRAVQSRLAEGDVLLFSTASDGSVTVERRNGGSFSGKFARL